MASGRSWGEEGEMADKKTKEKVFLPTSKVDIDIGQLKDRLFSC